MKCLYCEKEFKLIPTGIPGGANRQFCYNCLPIGLNRSERQKRTNELILDKAKQQKISIGCSKCGYNKNGAALEWHHLNPIEKDDTPANLLKHGTYEGWEAYQNEIKKCILLCANCHREEHFPNRQIELFDGEKDILHMHQPIINEYKITKSVRQTARNLNLGETYISNVLSYHNIKYDNTNDNKAVAMIDKKTKQIIKIFNSITDASKEVTGKEDGNGHICMVCRGKRISAYGYLWKYADDLDKS